MKRFFKSLVGLLGVFILLSVFFAAIVGHFECPTSEIQLSYEKGALAVFEQLALAIFWPATQLIDGWEESSVGVVYLGLIFSLQFWPMFILCVCPWASLPLWARRGVIGYAALWLIFSGVVFIRFRTNWHQIYGCCP